MGVADGWRTPLHAATDWPGYFPAAPEAVALLLNAGADPDVDTGGPRPETPLHWAASTDDVAEVLLERGADPTRPGGSIGTPLDNAIGHSCWRIARLLVARGAPVDKPWHAAGLGLRERLEQLLDECPNDSDALSRAFWHARAGGHRRVAQCLLARGAELNWVPDYAEGTPLDSATSLSTGRSNLLGWLREHGAHSAKPRAGNQ